MEIKVNQENLSLIDKLSKRIRTEDKGVIGIEFVLVEGDKQISIYEFTKEDEVYKEIHFEIEGIGYLKIRKNNEFSLTDKLSYQEITKLILRNWEFGVKYDYRFFQNRDCQYFPCHEFKNEDSFNCLFCYCPLYLMEDCKGNYKYTKNGVKDCSNCLVPHIKDNYDHIIKMLFSQNHAK
ncbi:MAG: cysteine-rich small domain-containing protein [Erysipelotrichales bacterium]